MIHQSTSIVINRPAAEVFGVVADVTRMGEWSPECTECRWVAPATGPALGATFEGDNVASLGPITLKKWTTTSEITAFEQDRVFEFLAEDITTWRYELTERDGVTTLTESFSHAPFTGTQGFLYNTVMRRPAGMTKGMQQTLAKMKAALEA
jgi:Polyketide cyclase / dehydrase and lipid transport